MPPDLDQAPEVVEPVDTEIPSSGIRSWTIGLALMIVVVIGAVFAVVIALSGGSDDGSASVIDNSTASSELTYVVPAGTGDRIDNGETVQVIPDQIVIHVDQTLVLINDDDRTHNLGGYYVRAGETMRVDFPRPGLYMNSCSVNSGALVYVHVEA